jgi:hypothetical protein
MSDTIIHLITKSEIDYGILSMRHGDETYDFFQTLPKKFTVSIRGKQLFDRKISGTKVWIGYTIMRQFQVDEKVTISKKGSIVYIK